MSILLSLFGLWVTESSELLTHHKIAMQESHESHTIVLSTKRTEVPWMLHLSLPMKCEVLVVSLKMAVQAIDVALVELSPQLECLPSRIEMMSKAALSMMT